MKRLIMLSLIILSVSSLFSIAQGSLNAVVPGNFGVAYPEDGIRMDNLVFLLEDSNESSFIFDNEIHKSELAEGLSMNVLYYGNLPGEYSVMLSADFLPEESDSSVCFSVPETAEEAVDLNLVESSRVRVSINEIGPQEGLEIMDMQVSTDDALHSNLRLDFKVV